MTDIDRSQPAAIPSPWMTVPEAAKYARRGVGSVYDACRTGELRATQSGRHAGRRGPWTIHRDAVDEWLGAPVTAKRPRAVRRSA
ncbi:helix-turn-helix domain-containing protein [Antrihabitans sp. YC3-6]|uniref:Helix-turn-helix domain-containing protein n=1 Tax=Antrihabitans stalagmiti TaxID=2799499 RepID=A0A934NWD8_9NOCA|nr:helix-turn-helix domain-containing protein [Antrihabitans stalagmiti]MBJ8342819.1 helix-turn-helix domain-containing protein [Antrihabitans stalagmiti]